MHWYKYMEARFARELIDHGRLRINSLNYYKNIENHGNAIGDAEENTFNAVSTSSGTRTFAQLNELERMVLRPEPGADPLSIIMTGTLNVTVPFQGKPTYGFCLSDSLSRELVTKINKENEIVGIPQYDTCVKIKDHVLFVRILSKYIKSHNLEYYGHGHCSYKSRDIPWDQWQKQSDQCPAFIKGLSYKWQKEVRIIFETQSHNDVEPIDCEIPELKELCEIIEIPKY